MDEKPVMMKIKDIVVKWEYYPRIGLDEETVARYQELYEMGVSLPPILIQKKGRIPIDGLHRLEAQIRLGREEVEVVFEDIPESEIYLRSIGSNNRHGRPFSGEDKYGQIRTLRFETTPPLTYEEIGIAVILSTSRVGEICREIEIEFRINGTIYTKIDGRSNLTPEENREIQDRLDAGERTSDIAADYPVGESRISQKRKEPRKPKPYKTTKGKTLSQMPKSWVRRWMVKRFKANNPTADISEIDLTSHLTVNDFESFHDLVGEFSKIYPQYEWLYPNERPRFNYYGDIPPELMFDNWIEIQVKLCWSKKKKSAQVKGTIPREILDYVSDRLHEELTIKWPLTEVERTERTDKRVFPEMSDEELSELYEKLQVQLSDEELSELYEKSQVLSDERLSEMYEKSQVQYRDEQLSEMYEKSQVQYREPEDDDDEEMKKYRELIPEK